MDTMILCSHRNQHFSYLGMVQLLSDHGKLVSLESSATRERDRESVNRKTQLLRLGFKEHQTPNFCSAWAALSDQLLPPLRLLIE